MSPAAPEPGLRPLDLDLDLSDLERAARPTARERWQWRAQTAGRRLRARSLDIGLIAVLVTVATVVHMRGMYDTPARFDDEGTYTAYAWAVEYRHTLGHYTYWYAHPPIGWIQMAAWNWLTDGFARAPYAVASVRAFMVVCKIASVVLLYLLALRLRLTRPAAVAAVLMFALSPLAVYFTRTALLDNIVTPWLLAAFLLAASRKRGLGSAAGAAVCFAMAVLTKETALLFMPALLLLFWQCSDRRNRSFTTAVFGATLTVLLLLYPAYALIKNEFFQGSNHVSLLWAIKWQLFDRQGSGSIFNSHSTAHAVVTSWVIQDPWLTRLALLCIVPGLIARRTRAVAVAFGVQVAELLRSGYLPYPFVVAMIPFGALTIAGVADVVWQRLRARPPRQADWWWTRALATDRCAARSVLPVTAGRVAGVALRVSRRPRLAVARLIPQAVTFGGSVVLRAGMIGAVVAGVLAVQAPWSARIHDLWYTNHDRGAATTLSWLLTRTTPDQTLVVDDSFWVDLVRNGHPQRHVIWFTKLDVDPAVHIPAPVWDHIDYIALTYQDEMSLHLTLQGTPTADTRASYPSMAAALDHARVLHTFGQGTDRVVLWRVGPQAASTGKTP